MNNFRSISQKINISRARLFSTLEATPAHRNVPLQAPIPKGAPANTGFNFVAQRFANIVLNMTDYQPSKILNVYPENAMVTYIGNVTHIDMNGAINKSLGFEFKDEDKFNSVDYLENFSTDPKLSYQTQTFHIGIQAVPVFKSKENSNSNSELVVDAPHMLSLDELFRVVTLGGFVLIGCPEGQWDKLGVLKYVEERKGSIQPMLYHKINIPIHELELFPNTSNDIKQFSSQLVKTKVDNIPAINYWIGVLRKDQEFVNNNMWEDDEDDIKLDWRKEK